MAIALLVVAAGSLPAWLLLGSPSTGIDDADIFFVYARHFAEGHGFVYNMGGERVEGFTSLLWTLICSAFFCFTQQVEIPLYLLNLLLGSVTVGICLRRSRTPILFVLLLLAVPAWFAWCQVTLMETGLWCLLLTVLILELTESRRQVFTLLLPLLVLTRPESMLWGLWLLLVFGWKNTEGREWRRGLKSMLLPGTVFAGTLAALVAFRISYFGYPLPNTFYAKVSTSLSVNLWNGAGYLIKHLFSNPAVLFVTATWAWILIRGLRRWREGLDRPTLIALCLLPGIGIPVLVGGDHFGGSRFYQPLWPLLCLLASTEWPALFGRVKPAKGRAVLLALVLCGWILFPLTSFLRHEFRIAGNGREAGAALTAMFDDMLPQPSVAVITAGGVKFAYPGTVMDLMGLNATAMAHAPGSRTGYKNHTAFNREVFYAWNPDILLCGEDPEFDAYVLKGLPDEQRFRNEYMKMVMQRNGREVEAYYSHAFIEQVHQMRE